MLAEIRRRAEAQVPAIVAQARADMNRALGGELERLRRLKKINDHIRAEEIEALARLMEELDRHIAAAALRLDSVLVIAGS